MMKPFKKILKIIGVCVIVLGVAVIGYSIQQTIRINRIIHAHQNDSAAEQSRTAVPEGSVLRAVQQIMIGALCNNYSNSRAVLQAIKAAGYDAIELNDFMIQKSSLLVRLMTQFSGMPIGKSGNQNWDKLIKESGLQVVSLHSNLAAIENNAGLIAERAKSFGTDTVVITGMYRFDYSSLKDVEDLADRLNTAGKILADHGVRLLYHNHNVELQRVTPEKTAYDIIIEKTDPQYVNFEFDSYWMADGGANVVGIMEKLGNRIKLWHINDRGHKKAGPYMSPILTEDCTELGYGNIDLETLAAIALKNKVEGVIVETHRNWVNDDPIQSFRMSASFLQKHFP